MNALILVDIQNDFLPTGALPVPEGDKVIAVANHLMPQFKHVIATQDWHPANHGSFAANHAGKKPGDLITLNGLPQILWPTHCVQNTPGAEFAPGLDRARFTHVVQKGTDPAIDSYSGFFDNGHKKATGLHEYLQSQGIRELCVMGLATDYCVKFTALDARQLGYHVVLELNGCRGVNLKPGDVEAAVAEMVRAGVRVVEEKK
ncbi:MAG: bifunctional nicotinamidase/pyrazinamidase [Phycisphaerae bacterium]